MIINDLFKKDINRDIRPVITIGNESEDQIQQELEEYVITNELRDNLRDFFRAYRTSLKSPTDRIGVWITGFFGSGKSHFLKILSYLLENKEVKGIKALSYFDGKIADEIVKADITAGATHSNTVVMYDISTRVKVESQTNPTAVLESMLRRFNERIGLCSTILWVADFERTLLDSQCYDKFTKAFEEISSISWKKGRNLPLLQSDKIIKALETSLSISAESAKKFFDNPQQNFHMDADTFAKIVSEYCAKKNTSVLFLVDEMGAFIGTQSSLMLDLQAVTQSFMVHCAGKAWVVVTSQQQLIETLEDSKMKKLDFSKIQGRFANRLLLSSSNADEVIKQRILEKNTHAKTPLMAVFEAEKSRISQLIWFQLAPSWNGYKDSKEFSEVYPFVPYQFDLVQNVFNAVREHGMSGQSLAKGERSLLSAFQESLVNIQNEQVGVLVPFNSFYRTVEKFIDDEIKFSIVSAARRTNISAFAVEVLKILFMIKYVEAMPATLERITTLMVSSIYEDKLELKNNIADALKRLEDETLIQKNGEKYDFLTNEEQDINRQVKSTSINEGDVIRKVSDAVFEKVLETNRFKYRNRYDFGLNRYVDYDLKGNQNAENINIKIITNYSEISDETELSTESMRSNMVIVDLRKGFFLDEMIQVTRIETFKRNNAVGKGGSFTEILAKKEREAVERRTRAEDLIKQALRSANIFCNGSILDIKVKDGRDRLFEALDYAVGIIYCKLDYIKVFTSEPKDISSILDGRDSSGMIESAVQANQSAYNELIEHVNNAKTLQRKVTVKSIILSFIRQPYGWKDLDIRALVAKLWFDGVFKILVHNTPAQKNDSTFKFDFVRRDNEENMVVLPQEKIDIQIIGSVKKIMKNAFNQNFDTKEESLKDDTSSFFKKKSGVLHDIDTKNSPEYPGKSVLKEIHKRFDRLANTGDTFTLFNDVISQQVLLIADGEMLDKLESFFADNSAQMRNYRDSIALINWYQQNRMVEELNELELIIDGIYDIIKLDSPFERIPELASLAFKGNEIKEGILTKKADKAKKTLQTDFGDITKEFENAVASEVISQSGKDEIKQLYQEYKATYDEWLGTISISTLNVDSYVSASKNNVTKYRSKIMALMNTGTGPGTPPSRGKRISLSKSISVANKKVSSQADIEKVITEIRSKLEKELEEVDFLEIE